MSDKELHMMDLLLSATHYNIYRISPLLHLIFLVSIVSLLFFN